MAPLQLVPWSYQTDLQSVAALLFPRDDLAEHDVHKRQERGIAIINNWKYRMTYPLRNFVLLEATAEILAAALTHVELKKSAHLARVSFAIRAAYSQAISRFVTTICDKENSGMHKAARQVDLPPYLVDLRHAIVHRLEPSLIELELAAKDCLQWLKSSFWDQLQGSPSDGLETSTVEQYTPWMLEVIEYYYSNRKAEIKAGGQSAQTSEVALDTKVQLSSVLPEDYSATRHIDLHSAFITNLLGSKRFWPKDVNETTMATAILMWDPLLLALSNSNKRCTNNLLHLFTDELIKPSKLVSSEDQRKSGLFHWLRHLLLGRAASLSDVGPLSSRRIAASNAVEPTPWSRVVDDAYRIQILDRCIIEPGTWTNQLRDLIIRGLPARYQRDYQEIGNNTLPTTAEKPNSATLEEETAKILHMALGDADVQAIIHHSGVEVEEVESTTESAAKVDQISMDPVPHEDLAGAGRIRHGWRLQTAPVIPRPIGICRSAALEILLAG